MFGFGKKEKKLPQAPPVPEYENPDFIDWKISLEQEMFLTKLFNFYFHELNQKAAEVAEGKKPPETLTACSAKLKLIKQLLENSHESI